MRHSDGFETGDIVLFLDSWLRRHDSDNPEMNLRRAMLHQAWFDWWSVLSMPLSKLERLTLAAWLRGTCANGKPYPSPPGFSFADICASCGLEPNTVRLAITTRKPELQKQMVRVPKTNMNHRITELRKRDRSKERAHGH